MKKILKFLLGVSLSLCLIFPFSACNRGDKKITIICTIFPQYDWVLQILGDNKDNFDVQYLLNSGVDLHSFQPSVSDMVAVKSCDLFIYVGGESDEWTEDALEDASNKNMTTIALLEIIEAKEEETIPGMQDDEHGNEESEIEYDEHVWLSLRNAQVLIDAITDAICELDSDNEGDYRANAAAYKTALSNLDGEYQEATEASAKDTILFANRFPFRYLADDYKLNYYAAFKGCSAETEASFATVQFLVSKVNELNLPAILVIETSDKSIAQTVKNNSTAKNQAILVMHSCQSVIKNDVLNGVTYLSLMMQNLDVLRQALV